MIETKMSCMLIMPLMINELGIAVGDRGNYIGIEIDWICALKVDAYRYMALFDRVTSQSLDRRSVIIRICSSTI